MSQAIEQDRAAADDKSANELDQFRALRENYTQELKRLQNDHQTQMAQLETLHNSR